MPSINLDDLQPGMVLAEDAAHLNGRVLLRAGTEINEKHIDIFRMWGVIAANIEEISQEDIGANVTEHVDPVIQQKAEDKMRELFQHTDLSFPPMADLFQLRLREYIALMSKEKHQ